MATMDLSELSTVSDLGDSDFLVIANTTQDKKILASNLPSATPFATLNADLAAAQAAIDNLEDEITTKAPIANPTFTGTVNIPSLKLNGHTTAVGSMLSSSLSSAHSLASGTAEMILSLSLPVGVWVLTAQALFATSSEGARRINISATSGSTSVDVQVPAVSAQQTALSETMILSVNSAATYYLNAYQSSGSSLNVSGAVFRAVRIA